MTETFPHGYVLLIGVDECAYPKWSLPVTVRDVQALAAALTDPHLCGYPPDHIRLLHGAGATKQAILDGLAWLAEQAAADPDATAIVYFSGHGWLEERSGRYYLIPHDVVPFDLPGSALTAEEFTAALRKVEAPRLLVFLDCCHPGGMAIAKAGTQDAVPLPPGLTPAAAPKGVTEALKQGTGRAVFSSSNGGQASYVRPDGSLSLYTYHLLEALQGAANRPGETVVRVSHLMNHLGRAVPESARALGVEQTPFFDAATEDFTVALLHGGMELPPVEEPLADYRALLRRMYADLPLAGIPVPLGLILPLDRVYIKLRALPQGDEAAPREDTLHTDQAREASRRLGERLWQQREEVEETPRRPNETQPIPPEEALARHERVVLLGEAGSGKSTLLRHLTWEWAGDPQAPLPLLIPLARADLLV